MEWDDICTFFTLLPICPLCSTKKQKIIALLTAEAEYIDHSHPQPSHIRCRWLFCSLSFSKRTNTMRYAKTTVWTFCLFIYFSCMLARMCSAIIDGYHFCGVHWHRNVRYPWPFLYSHSYTSCGTRSCLCPSWFAGISWHHPRDWAAH